MDLVLSSSTENDVAFQYYVQPGKLGPDANTAVHHALGGDLSLLTAMEDTMHALKTDKSTDKSLNVGIAQAFLRPTQG